ncbi:MAG TPA: sterol desaturase family protein [Chitinophagaceae bacterium]|nr:sterol desaturase family protein [Chitinophagaceae bacterium]
MNVPDFSSPHWMLLLTLGFFIVITGRYFVIAGIFYLIFYIWFPEKWEQRKLNKKNYKPEQLKTEIKWSVITGLIFSFSGTATVILWQKGFTKVYTDIHEYGLWYLPASLVISMLLHETYYYWLHRWMHRPKIFRMVHKVHHDSHITSPFTAFSFHPLEGLLQAIFFPLILLILPMHYCTILVQLVIMTFSSVINHLDIEIYPKNFNNNMLGKWLIGATHHSLHHKQFKYNYGLYFTFWDKLKKTESPLFKRLFETATLPREQGAPTV